MKKHSFQIIPLVCIVLSGCSIPTKPYVEPSSGPVVGVTFVAGEGARAAYVTQHGDSGCNVLNEIDALLSENPESTFVFTGHPIVKEKTIRVAANSEFSFQIADNRGIYRGVLYCGASAAFTPQEGHEYRIVWSFPSSCGVRILSRTADQMWTYRTDLGKARYCKS